MAERDERAARGEAPPGKKWTTRLATDDDIRRFFGSGNLLIGSRVRPTIAEPTQKEEASATEREPRQNTAER
jgi:hypothetical protein